MRVWVAIFWLFTGATAAVLGQRAIPRPQPIDPLAAYRQTKQALFVAFPRQADTVMLGDSLIEMFDWQAAFPHERTANLGISGDTIAGVAARLDTVIALQPARVVIMAGINDVRLGRPGHDIAATYVAVVDRLRTAGAVVIVTSPVAGDAATAGRLAPINAALRQHCGDGACRFVDLTMTLAPSSTYDGTHLTVAGYRAWIDALAPYLKAPAQPDVPAPR